MKPPQKIPVDAPHMPIRERGVSLWGLISVYRYTPHPESTMTFTTERAPDLWVYFNDGSSPVGVYSADLDDYLDTLAVEGLYENVHYTVGGPF